jgi:dTDP-4-amino-4,6-dideoxygalactose transaminase
MCMSVTTYETEFARLLGANHAITFAYARHALVSIFSAAGLRAGDAVVLSPLTCKVVPLALLSLNLKPVYADISATTLNLDPESVEKAIGPTTRAVLFQHTYGNSAGVEAVAQTAAARKVPLFEDCAQCLPHAKNGRSAGSWGKAAVFSNNLRKPLPSGSGGVAVTNDSGLARKIQQDRDRLPYRSRIAELMLRAEILIHKHLLRPSLYWPLFDLSRRFRNTYKSQPIDSQISREMTGTAMQVSEYQMREGSSWLPRLETIVAHRCLSSAEYAEAMRSIEKIEMPCGGSEEPLYYFPVLVDRKDELLRKARAKRIELIAWPLRLPIFPLEDESMMSAYGYEHDSCPVAESVARRLVGLPTDLSTRAEHREAVIALLKGHLGSVNHEQS